MADLNIKRKTVECHRTDKSNSKNLIEDNFIKIKGEKLKVYSVPKPEVLTRKKTKLSRFVTFVGIHIFGNKYNIVWRVLYSATVRLCIHQP